MSKICVDVSTWGHEVLSLLWGVRLAIGFHRSQPSICSSTFNSTGSAFCGHIEPVAPVPTVSVSHSIILTSCNYCACELIHKFTCKHQLVDAID